ncbi:MAG: STAS domain-containing protein [Fibrobacteres bacterium]|nr:STAS domain-containing protein [Fibrobacterota bacterium]
MLSKRSSIGKFCVVAISDEFTVVSDLQELDIFIDGLILKEINFIAVRFEKISYIYSGALAILVKNAKKLKERGGEIVLLEPNRDVDDIMKITNLHNAIRMFHTEDELRGVQN